MEGASSKVGWAVARTLRHKYGYDVMCHSTDESRRRLFNENGFQSASNLHEGAAFTSFWIIGKYDTNVLTSIPQNSTAICFSVPNPFCSPLTIFGGSRRHQLRDDVRVVEAGTLHVDLSRFVPNSNIYHELQPRRRLFTNKLEEHEIFACHAAGIVAAHMLRKENEDLTILRNGHHDETGPVDPNKIDEWLKVAKEIGFRIPAVLPAVVISPSSMLSSSISSLRNNFVRHQLQHKQQYPVVIIGAGPAGLATAAILRRRGIVNCYILERQVDKTLGYGSWCHHFSGLKITTQKKWCRLPYDDNLIECDTDKKRKFSARNNDDFVTAEEYTKYLHRYANRYNIEIKRGYTFKSIRRGRGVMEVGNGQDHKTSSSFEDSSPSLSTAPWFVECINENKEQQKHGKIEGVAPLSSSPLFFPASAVVLATGKTSTPQRDTTEGVGYQMHKAGIDVVHSSDLKSDEVWEKAVTAADRGTLCVVGFGNSAADICTSILQRAKKRSRRRNQKKQSKQDTDNEDYVDVSTVARHRRCSRPQIHVSARTVPPVFPRSYGFLRIDTTGSYLRRLPIMGQTLITTFLQSSYGIPATVECDQAFPLHLPRWKARDIGRRIPIIDKEGCIVSGLRSKSIIGHGSIIDVIVEEEEDNNISDNNNDHHRDEVTKKGVEIVFDDNDIDDDDDNDDDDDDDDDTNDKDCNSKNTDDVTAAASTVRITMAIMATGYTTTKESSSSLRQDRLNGLFKVGFGHDNYLPLKSIGEEAKIVAEHIIDQLHVY